MKSNDQVGTRDKVTITKDKVKTMPEKKEFTVISEAGLFKNGKRYKKGSKISLDEKTATNFLASKDIK